MTHSSYTVSRRFGLIWAWRLEQGPGAPARGVAVTKAGARYAARTRIRRALLAARQLQGDLPAPACLEETGAEDGRPMARSSELQS
jgi:hypothetical protein